MIAASNQVRNTPLFQFHSAEQTYDLAENNGRGKLCVTARTTLLAVFASFFSSFTASFFVCFTIMLASRAHGFNALEEQNINIQNSLK